MNTIRIAIAIAAATALSGCATLDTHGKGSHASDAGAIDPSLLTDEPLAGDSATLEVNGLSCPQCASNLTLTLEEVSGVSEASINLATGDVEVTFGIGAPSSRALADAVDNAGFTLVAINSK